VTTLFPVNPPLFLARTPHGYHNVRLIRDDTAAAGFIDVAVETVHRRSQAASPRQPAVGFCQGTPLRGEIETQGADKLGQATDAAAAAIAARFGAGLVEGKIQAHIITAQRA
jgi:hypothetical protein